MKKRTELHFNIAEDVMISGYQPVVFFKDTELGELYSAMVERWKIDTERKRGVFTDSIFYSLGRVHGIREERARRKKENCAGAIINTVDHESKEVML